MRSDSLTWLQLLAPTLFVLGALYLLANIFSLASRWGRYLIFLTVWSVVFWYVKWRFLETVLPTKGAWYEIGWVWFCFAIEFLAIADQLILYVTFLRTSNHSAEADRHEARLRALTPAQLPSVDVFIPTYNEPMIVLEKTIVGALCLDYPNVNIWVLDDGRRPWLKAFCESKGAGYLTRPDNAHAKAGNVNHALKSTTSELVAIFDADFVPQQNFLMRTVGFFEDPTIGIVQTPHAFYNPDPMQTNLAIRKSLPDEQRFFFDTIMPSRDAWDAAFCCGSNSVTRRSALNAIGGALPTQSITEDMLLTMTLLREGYKTRYLCERLAFGLAPESVDAFFVQRERWARGAIQILYLRDGPFGRGLTLMQRLLFTPTHWLSLGFRSLLAIVAPVVFLWLGLSPVFDVSPSDVVYYFVPMVLALAGGIWAYAPGQQFPLASQVQSTFLSFRILPTVLQTLVRPFGHPFKVTPKGETSAGSYYCREVFWSSAWLMGLTFVGLIINSIPEWRVIENADVLPVVAFWSAINIIVLFLVCLLSLQAPMRRGEERLEISEPIWVVGPNGTISSGKSRDLSLSGAGLDLDNSRAPSAKLNDRVRIFVSEVGFIAGTVVRQDEQFLGIRFELPPSVERDLLIRKMFASGRDTTNVITSGWNAAGSMLKSIWALQTRMMKSASANETIGSKAALHAERLPASSLVVMPQAQRPEFRRLGESRRKFAA